MLFVYFLIAVIAVLLAFSLSKDTGKNTKYARKRSISTTHQSEPNQIDTSSTVEIR